MIYDIAIIGAGPAGLSASVYASRYGLSNVVVGEVGGGLTAETHEIGNWLGTEKISGFEFANNAMNHVKSLGVEIKTFAVDKIDSNEKGFKLFLSDGSSVFSKTIILTMGTKRRRLGIPGEKGFFGKGISYCATCDGFFYRDKKVAVVGGGDSAASAAVYLSGIAKKVFLIYRGEKLRAETFWVNNIEKNSKIEVLYNTNLKEIQGDEKMEKVILDSPYKNSDELSLDGVFIEIGLTPNTEMIKDLEVELDEEGYVRIDPDGRTSVSHIWAAGDITNGSNKFRQIVTAASEGAIAANSVQKYLSR